MQGCHVSRIIDTDIYECRVVSVGRIIVQIYKNAGLSVWVESLIQIYKNAGLSVLIESLIHDS